MLLKSFLLDVVTAKNNPVSEYLNEIILVDDHSELLSLEETLPELIKSLFPPTVKLIRNRRREGLIRARMIGAAEATGDVLLFLDSHCEVGPGWLEPLLQRITEDYRNIPMPSHDAIDPKTFEFVGSKTVDSHGTFGWDLIQNWQALPEIDKLALKGKTDAVKSPTMSGCMFGISRRWWDYLGKFDPGFEVWGAENLELSFKTWMCGGKLEIIPCSHVGHVFRVGRKTHASHVRNSLEINQKRLAEVWMDEYKEIVYLKQPKLKSIDPGDISERISLRHRLNCESFDWYLKNIHPDKHVPSLNLKAGDGLMSFSNHCMDSLGLQFGPVKLYKSCQFPKTQVFQYTENLQLRAGVDACLEYNEKEMTVHLAACSDKQEQKWTHSGPSKSIRTLLDTSLCMTSKNDDVIITKCVAGDESQLWKFKRYFEPKKDF